MRTLTVRHSASTPSSSAARAPFCPNLAGIQDHNDLLEVMRLHLKTPGTRHGEGSCGRFSGLHLEFLAVAAGMGVDLIILVASDLQDHLLADRDVDLLPLGSTLPLTIVMLIVSADGLAKAGLRAKPRPSPL